MLRGGYVTHSIPEKPEKWKFGSELVSELETDSTSETVHEKRR